MSNKALVVINNSSPIEGQLLKGADKTHLSYKTSDGAFTVTATSTDLSVKFVGEGVGYLLAIGENDSSLSLTFNGNPMGYSAINKKVYRFIENETGFFLTTEYELEQQSQSITLSATII